MTHDELMAYLADRPGCCAGLRLAATEEIIRLKAKVDRLESAVAAGRMEIERLEAEVARCSSRIA